MNAVTHDFEEQVPPDNRYERAEGWFETRLSRWSIRGKLRLAIYSIALIPFLATATLLFAFGFFAKAGADHAKRVETEIYIAQAALAMTSVSEDVRKAGAEQDATALAAAKVGADRALDLMERASALAQQHYPDTEQAEFAEAQRTLELCLTEMQKLTLEDPMIQFEAVRADMVRQANNLSTLFDICLLYTSPSPRDS